MKRGLRSILTAGAAICLTVATMAKAPAQANDASCRAEIATFCTQVTPGEGRVARCLEQSFWQLSPACQEHASAVAANLTDTMQGCHDEILVHCTRADVAGNRVAQCLAKQRSGLSPNCLALAKLLWKK